MSVTIVPTVGDLTQPWLFPGANVRAGDWSKLVALLQHLNGGNGPLVTAHFPYTVVSSGQTRTLRWRAIVRPNALARVWIVSMVGTTVGSTVEVRAPEDSSSPTTVRLPSAATNAKALSQPAFAFVETVADPDSLDLSIAFACTAGGCVVYSVACYELPRRYLGVTDRDLGAIQQVSVAPNQVVQNRGTVEGIDGGFYSLPGINAAAEIACRENARKSSLFSYSSPEEATTPVSNGDTTTFVPVMMIARKTETAQTQRTVALLIRATITGDGGTFTATAESGDSVTITIDGVGGFLDDPPWYIAALEIDVHDHDEVAYGQPSRPYGDHVTFEVEAAAVGTVSLTSIEMFENEGY